MAGVKLMMEKAVKRIVERFWPELLARHHLPLWGKIVNDPPAISDSVVSTPEKPLYAVDVAMLDDHGEIDMKMPVLKQVPLPASFCGDGRGLFGFPQKNTLVELGFIRGLPTKPFIRTVLVEKCVLPVVDQRDVLIQQSETTYQRATETSWNRTSKVIQDEATTYSEKIAEIKESIAGLEQNIRVTDGGKIWLGNDSYNVLQILSDFMGIVQSMASDLASHTHTNVKGGDSVSGPPAQAGGFSQSGNNIGNKKESLNAMH